jgi:thioredoxin 1
MMVVEVTDKSFEQEVEKSNIPVLVDFWAEWCGPCRMLSPIVDIIASEMSGKLKVAKMDIENNPEMPSKLGVRSIPTLMLFKDGKVISTKVGALAKEVIEEWLNRELK